jgi:hypothetical protein
LARTFFISLDGIASPVWSFRGSPRFALAPRVSRCLPEIAPPNRKGYCKFLPWWGVLPHPAQRLPQRLPLCRQVRVVPAKPRRPRVPRQGGDSGVRHAPGEGVGGEGVPEAVGGRPDAEPSL